MQRTFLKDLIQIEMAKVNCTTFPYKNSKRISGVPFLATYHTLLKQFKDTLKAYFRYRNTFL